LADNLSLPGMAFYNIARRLQGEKVDFIDLDGGNENFFSRIRKMLWSKIM
jgi:septum site-determining protein MinD